MMSRKLTLLICASILVALSSLAGAQANKFEGRARANALSVHTTDPADPLTPVGNAFTYQGRLLDGGNPANGQYDFLFSLYDASTGGNQIGSTLTRSNHTVTNGLFTVTLNFGPNAFQGSDRWLEIAVRQTGGQVYAILSPRQALAATPYASSLVPGAVITASLPSPALVLSNTNGTGLLGVSSATDGQGVVGIANDGTSARGVYGQSAGGNGVYGLSTAFNGQGVYGVANNGVVAAGVYGTSSSGFGVWGVSTDTDGEGVYGNASNGSNAKGVYGFSTSGYG